MVWQNSLTSFSLPGSSYIVGRGRGRGRSRGYGRGCSVIAEQKEEG